MKIKFIMSMLLCVVLTVACNKTVVENDCVEKIDPECFCTMHYDPVCGCNNKTYGNACVANCSGITEYTEGECP